MAIAKFMAIDDKHMKENHHLAIEKLHTTEDDFEREFYKRIYDAINDKLTHNLERGMTP